MNPKTNDELVTIKTGVLKASPYTLQPVSYLVYVRVDNGEPLETVKTGGLSGNSGPCLVNSLVCIEGVWACASNFCETEEQATLESRKLRDSFISLMRDSKG